MINTKKLLTTAVLITAMIAGTKAQIDSIDYLTSPFQLTFLSPPLSTNGFDNANYVNNMSINLFLGVSGGVDGVEMGGFINVDRFFVKGIQLAGFGNTVGGDVDGVQLSGFYNTVGGNVGNVQGSGFINITTGNQTGLQGAGFMNAVGGNLYGFQGAGFMNVIGGRMTGIQGSGFMNVNGGSVTGLQGAGFMNVAGNFNSGVQGAGFANVAGNGNVNLQAAGFINIADTVKGAQLSGFINRAEYVKGLQAAGFINIADSIDGVPIAFISIVKKNGYRNLEIATSETQIADLSFRLGVPKLYTIYSISKPYGSSTRWLAGVGIGTQADLSPSSFLNIEAVTNWHFYMGDDRAPWFIYSYRFNAMHQLRVTYARSVGRVGEFFVGPTLNVTTAHTDPRDDLYIPWEPIQPSWAFYDVTYDTYHQTNVALWLGVRGGFRF